MTDPVAALREGLRDRYAFERELGRGGMATVFLAQDLRYDRPVALKVLHQESRSATIRGSGSWWKRGRRDAGLAGPTGGARSLLAPEWAGGPSGALRNALVRSPGKRRPVSYPTRSDAPLRCPRSNPQRPHLKST